MKTEESIIDYVKHSFIRPSVSAYLTTDYLIASVLKRAKLAKPFRASVRSLSFGLALLFIMQLHSNTFERKIQYYIQIIFRNFLLLK